MQVWHDAPRPALPRRLGGRLLSRRVSQTTWIRWSVAPFDGPVTWETVSEELTSRTFRTRPRVRPPGVKGSWVQIPPSRPVFLQVSVLMASWLTALPGSWDHDPRHMSCVRRCLTTGQGCVEPVGLRPRCGSGSGSSRHAAGTLEPRACWSAAPVQAGAGTPSSTMTGKTRSVFFSYSLPSPATLR
jgi:hypothetical protein